MDIIYQDSFWNNPWIGESASAQFALWEAELIWQSLVLETFKTNSIIMNGYHWICGCTGVCAICGHKKHTGVHMHCAGSKPGDRPWGHVFKEAP